MRYVRNPKDTVVNSYALGGRELEPGEIVSVDDDEAAIEATRTAILELVEPEEVARLQRALTR